MLGLLLLVASLVALYYIIRTAVTHGILDADDARRARDREERFDKQLREGTLPDAPQS